MKKTLILAALATVALTANAQEADRVVGRQHVRFQTACHPEDVKTYDTKTLRERFVMEEVMKADSIMLTYSHYDRFIFGGAMPVNQTLKLENFWELGLDVDNTIPEKYSNIATDPSQMDIVAFISSWDDYAYPQGPTGKDFEDCEVHNTISTCIGELPRKAQKPLLPNGLTPVGPPTKRTEITIADGTTYTTTVAKHYDSVTYTRDYEDTNWQALYVPFAINYDEWSTDYEIARVYNFIEYDDNQDGVNDRAVLVFQKKNAGSTEPNTPYFIRAKVAGEKSLTLENRTLQPAKVNSVDCGSVDYDYTFTGTYTTITDMYTRGYYTLCDGYMKLADSATDVLSPQRWYMEVTPRNGANATRAQVIQFVVAGEDGVEGIEQLTTSGATHTSYDLQGRRLTAPAKRGIQIVNGSKIIR